MANQSGAMDYWRKYFKSANGDIFEVIQQAIMVAASDCPNEFQIRRDEIAEKLYTCRLPRCFGCHGVELAVPKEEGGDVVKDNSVGNGCSDDVREKDSKGTCSTNVNSDLIDAKGSNISYHEAEALTDMLEEENQMIEEVFRIKEILVNSVDQSSTVLFESLRRLELMDVTVQTLMSTNIAKAVSALRKHSSKEIAKLARNLVKSWKNLISEWIAATEAAKGSNDSPDSVNPSVIDEEEFGLPSPPLDDGVFFASEPTSMELSKFFDGMDDDGNLDGGRNGNDNGRKFGPGSRNVQKETNNLHRKPQLPREQNVLPKDNKNHSVVKQESVIRQTKPSNSESGSGMPSKLGLEQRPNNEARLQQRMDTSKTQRKPPSGQLDKPKPSGQVLDQKLELAKRKLHQGYQQAENAKKQRTIQVMDLQDLPKQTFGSNSKSSNVRPGSNNNRNWSNGRR